MTPVFEINAANNAKTEPDIKSSIQKYQSTVHKEWTYFR